MARRLSSKGDATPDAPDSTSSLALIREKELEFDGLVMVARSEAEKCITEAAAQSESALLAAEAEADRLTADSESRAMAAAQAEIDTLRHSARDQLASMREVAVARRRAMVDEIVRATLGG